MDTKVVYKRDIACFFPRTIADLNEETYPGELAFSLADDTPIFSQDNVPKLIASQAYVTAAIAAVTGGDFATDTELAAEVATLDAAITAAIATAEGYTDTAIADLASETYVNNAIADNLIGTQVGAELATERTTLSASYTQVTDTGIAIAVSNTVSEIIVEFEAKVATSDGTIKTVLASTNVSEDMVNGATTLSGQFSNATVMQALSNSVHELSVVTDTAYKKYRVHIVATRLTAGTFYINIFFKNSVGDPSITYIKNINVFTN